MTQQLRHDICTQLMPIIAVPELHSGSRWQNKCTKVLNEKDSKYHGCLLIYTNC